MDTIDGRVVIVTGAARGIGRGHALEFARSGYRVVVNDLGAEVDGTGSSSGPAGEVVEEIRAMGGEAIANGDDVADWGGAQHLITSTVEHFGGLHVLVNNAGILRDRMLVNMSAEEWDAIIHVHLRGTFAPLRHAAAYWRDRFKAGQPVDARVINTTSSSGIYGNVGQTNYGAAKAGIAAFTVIAAQELGRYGITVNALAPAALTRMTENLRPDRPVVPEGQFDPSAADNIAPLAVWLAGPAAREVTGRVFNIRGGHLSVAEGWSAGPGADHGTRWTQEALDDVMPALLREAAPNAGQDGSRPAPVEA